MMLSRTSGSQGFLRVAVAIRPAGRSASDPVTTITGMWHNVGVAEGGGLSSLPLMSFQKPQRRRLPVLSSRHMARGWESKAVESQQDSAREERRTGPPVAVTDAVRRGERASLALAKSRAEKDLERASVPAHRSMLEQAIAELDRRIAALSDAPR